MPNRRNYQDRQRSNEPYNARSEYGRPPRSNYGSSEYDRGDDYYDSERSRYGANQPGSFSGGDFGRGYSGGGPGYPETFGGHGSSEGLYSRSYGYADRTDSESEFQNRGRNYENRNMSERERGDTRYGRNYPPQTSFPRSNYPGSERGYYGGARDAGDARYEEDRGWWNKATDEVSSWMGDEEAARRREMDAIRHGQYRGYGPKSYKRADERIKDDINDHLTDHAYLDASEIEVEVHEGNVILMGTVINRYAKRMAEDITDDVSGVRNVENRLRVQGKASWVAGAGDINSAGNRTTFTDIEDTEVNRKTMSKNA
jgi:osmotically-inducible protein OsmY